MVELLGRQLDIKSKGPKERERQHRAQKLGERNLKTRTEKWEKKKRQLEEEL